jgi:hypothetical protein
MKRSFRISVGTVSLLVGIGVTAKLAFELISVSPQSVQLKPSGNRDGENSGMIFEVINHGQNPIVVPDSLFLEYGDGSITNLSLAGAGNVRVAPGATGTVAIPRPSVSERWRLGANYYEEALEFKVKTRINQSPMGDVAPSITKTLKGKVSVSEWFN